MNQQRLGIILTTGIACGILLYYSLLTPLSIDLLDLSPSSRSVFFFHSLYLAQHFPLFWYGFPNCYRNIRFCITRDSRVRL